MGASASAVLKVQEVKPDLVDSKGQRAKQVIQAVVDTAATLEREATTDQWDLLVHLVLLVLEVHVVMTERQAQWGTKV